MFAQVEMSRFSGFSLRAKLTLILLSISALALICASMMDVVLSWKMERKQIMRRMEANAAIISLQSKAALQFLDPVAARENLASLHPNPNIQKACVYNDQKQPFAAYERDKEESAVYCPAPKMDSHVYRWNSMEIYKEIWSGDRMLGTLYLEYTLKDMYSTLLQETIYKWGVMFLILGLIWPVSIYLQRIISQPIAQLGEITRIFAKDRTKAIYAQKRSNDELGQLVEAYNAMMEEIRRNEVRMAEAINELQRSNAELERFAYICSHDLQEPLRMIVNYANLLEKRYGEKFEGESATFMGFITESATRMRELINDILAYARIGHHVEPMQPVDMNGLVDYVFKSMESSFTESGAKIERSNLPTIRGNKTLLGQLMQNLISNAVKFCRTSPVVTVRAEHKGDAWEFSVRDNGIGIDARYHDRIFEIFKRLNRREEFRGTGIGLAICKKAVEFHGGRIWLESAEGKGTTFFFTIPDLQLGEGNGIEKS